MDKYLADLIRQKREFQTGFFGIEKEAPNDSEEKIVQMYEKYKDNFSLECSVIVYKTLAVTGKGLIRKSLPIGTFVDELQGRIMIPDDVLALEVHCKGAWYDGKGRKHILGGASQEGMIFCNKVVFAYKADAGKLGYFSDALICTKEDFSSFCKFFTVQNKYSPEPKPFYV